MNNVWNTSGLEVFEVKLKTQLDFKAFLKPLGGAVSCVQFRLCVYSVDYDIIVWGLPLQLFWNCHNVT